ncbi:Squalene-hopene cyclase C-terminal domain-containing protein [Lentzea flava]|nr:Squalene-hopene cyclase C-terminal domain-containing protein [Lentzea flava]
MVHTETPEGPARWIEGCQGPVWDTALVLNALLDSGFDPDQAAMRRATDWLLDHEVRYQLAMDCLSEVGGDPAAVADLGVLANFVISRDR